MVNRFVMDAGDYGQGYNDLPDSLGTGRFTDNFDLRKLWVVKLEFMTGRTTVSPLLRKVH